MLLINKNRGYNTAAPVTIDIHGIEYNYYY